MRVLFVAIFLCVSGCAQTTANSGRSSQRTDNYDISTTGNGGYTLSSPSFSLSFGENSGFRLRFRKQHQVPEKKNLTIY